MLDTRDEDSDLRMKEQIVSSHLRKKNCRYFRTPGNKFLSKFDSLAMARSFLEGMSPSKEKPETLPKGLKQMYKRKLRVPENLSEEEQYVMKMMIEEEDDTFYWTASRNEKINLLLKGKKHS